MILLAMDRATVRMRDKDGRLHVAESNIAKACVSPYYGEEIPGWETLGLDARSVYQMLRDPIELERAVSTANNIQLLMVHNPVHANDPKKEIVVGTIGSNAAWSSPYIKNSLAVWDGEAIDLINSEQQKELSPAYHYAPDMTPGTFNGVAFDGVMRDIVFNHVALVTEGRQGPDVVVGDESMLKSRKALMVSGAVAGLIRPKLAQDAKVDLTGLFGGITAKNLGAKRGKLAKSVVDAVTPHLAADAAIELDDVSAVIDAVHTMKLAQDEKDEIAEDEDKEDLAEDEDEDKDDKKKDVAEDEDPDDKDKPAMDAATVTRMISEAEARGAKKGAKIAADAARDLRVAEQEVSPLIGALANPPASAEDVYKLALDSKNVDLSEVHPSAYRSMVRLLVDTQEAKPRVAMDGAMNKAAADSFAELYGSN